MTKNLMFQPVEEVLYIYMQLDLPFTDQLPRNSHFPQDCTV